MTPDNQFTSPVKSSTHPETARDATREIVDAAVSRIVDGNMMYDLPGIRDELASIIMEVVRDVHKIEKV